MNTEPSGNQRAKNQHYVPQFLLRRFGDNNQRVNVYDKHRRKTFVSSPRNIASENDFYELKIGDIQIALEPMMTQIENSACGHLNGIVENRTLSTLTSDAKSSIAFFMANQLLRTRAALEGVRQMADGLRRVGPSKGLTPESMPSLFMDDEQQKQMSLMNLELAHDLAPRFLNKDWLLCRDSRHRYLISDNPLVRKNYYPSDPMMPNNGIGREGIEIYMPLSPELTLGFFCPTLSEKFRTRRRENPEIGIPLLDALDAGSPLDLDDDSVTYQNSLQIAFSSRFIFSATSDFTLVDTMLDRKPSLAKPKYFRVT